jgi:phosphatidylcholine synthase
MNHRVFLAWCVHAYTALGLVCALLALGALAQGEPRLMFLWLVLAFIIDASDGVLARRARVHHYTPHFSGRKLDDIIDYLNYTFVPVCFVGWSFLELPLDSGLATFGWVLVLGMTLIASAYGFCSDAAKTGNGYFTGFPSYWNVVAFYLYLLDPAHWLVLCVILGFAAMTFWPLRYLYPTKNSHGQWFAIGGGVVWGLGCVAILLLPAPPAWAVWLSLVYPAWYLAYSFWLHVTQPPDNAYAE